MKIDLQITFDDLSEKCKKEIKRLKDAGYDVNIIYPSIHKKIDRHDYFPQWPNDDPIYGSTTQPRTIPPYDIICRCKGN